MPEASETTASSPHIVIAAADPLSQARLWLRLGHVEAIEHLSTMLRTALLLADRVQLDITDVLDGAYFLSLGPDGVARALGLDPGAPLPLSITFPAPHPGFQGIPGERTIRTHPGTGFLPVLVSEGRVSLTEHRDRVRRRRFQQLSAAMAAVEGPEALSHPWMLPPAAPVWFPGCGFVDVLHVLAYPDHIARIEHAQDAWLDAIERGRTAVTVHPDEPDVTAALTTRHPLPLAAKTPLSDTLQEVLITPPDRLSAELQPLDRPRNADRRDWVEYLTRIGFLHQETGTDDGPGAAHLCAAVADWAYARQQATARRDHALFLFFDDDEPRLTAPPPDRSTTAISAELIGHLRILSPPAYAQLARTAQGSPVEVLAVRARNAAGESIDPDLQQHALTIRIVAATALTAILTSLLLFTDPAALPLGGRLALLPLLALLATAACLPWADVLDRRRLQRLPRGAILEYPHYSEPRAPTE